MKKVIIVGHKNPDTDSIVSALGAKEYFSSVLKMEAEAKRAGEINNETKFVLEKAGVEIPQVFTIAEKEESIVLVDHNEATQAVDDLDFSKVEHIFDHHKVFLQTEKPIFFRAEPIGSTSSLIAKMFFEKGAEITKQTAVLLMAGVLSDTLNLTSPTTTSEDKEIVEKLNEIAQLDKESFVEEMFVAKSSLEGIATDEIINQDKKDFAIGEKEVGVAVWETTKPEGLDERKAEIFDYLRKKKDEENLTYLFFAVVDILKQNCQLFIIGEDEKILAKRALGGEIADNIMFLPGVVSRKKQIIPQLTAELEKMATDC